MICYVTVCICHTKTLLLQVEVDAVNGLRRVSGTMARRGSLEVASHLAALKSSQSLIPSSSPFGRRSVQRPAAGGAAMQQRRGGGGAAARHSSLPTQLPHVK